MMTVTLHFDHGYYFDQMIIHAETLEELRAIEELEVEKRKPETHWSSNFHDPDSE